jgi:WD40 repeat protein
MIKPCLPYHRPTVRAVAVLAAFAGVATLFAQQPAAPADPTAINPAQARPDPTGNGRLASPGFAIAYSEGPGLLVAACEDGSLHYWEKDVALGVRGADAAAHIVTAHRGPATALAAARNLIASAGSDGKILIWDLPGEKALLTLEAGSVVRALAASPDGKILASAGDGGFVQLWDPATGKPGIKLEGPKDWLLAVAVSPDGKTVAAGGIEGKLYLWDAASGKSLATIPAQQPPQPNAPAPDTNVVTALAFSPDSKQVAVGGSSSAIYLFEAADGKFVRPMAAGHTSSITSVAFHANNTLLVSASKDRTLRLWNPANGQLYKALEGHTAWVQGVTFMAQGTRVASVGADASVRLWDLSDPAKK